MKFIFNSLFLVVVMAFLTGMSRMENTESEQKSADKKPHAQHQTVKPHAKIDLDYKLPKEFSIDVPETLSFTVINGRDSDEVKIKFTLDEGLILNTTTNEISFGSAAAGSAHKFELQLIPRQNGLYYVNVFASMLINGKYQTRSFAVPVSVGEYDLQKQRRPAGVISEDVDGQRVISMPAVETTD